MSLRDKRKHLFKVVLIGLAILAVLIAGTVIGVRRYYEENLKPVSSDQNVVEVTIESGSLLPKISNTLKEKNLIRNKRVFEGYVRSNGSAQDIKAGTYEISPSYGVPEIVSILTNGKIVSKLVTILPGSRLDQIHKTLINAGFSEDEVNAALDPASYPNHPALVDKPADASLEGYLYPESFQRDSATTAKSVVQGSLDEMQKRLTPEVREAFTRQGLSVHKAITLASIVEREVSSASDRQQVAQVFLKRIANGMSLQSDVTAQYGAIHDGVAQDLTGAQILQHQSAYNTYIITGLPPGPISNVSESSINAVANPAKTDWLYFVAGDDGTTYFSKTLAEHEALTKQHCTTLCGN